MLFASCNCCIVYAVTVSNPLGVDAPLVPELPLLKVLKELGCSVGLQLGQQNCTSPTVKFFPFQVEFAILDEADQMLDIGFADDVEKILSEAPKERQTMLFSATMPTWVKKLTRKHQRDPLLVDLVGDEEAGKMAESIRYFVVLSAALLPAVFCSK